MAVPKIPVPPLVPRVETSLPDLSPDNIIQMTENDVTVNAVTGGLKFRVDPQTLSSNKMYRLPDGRIFAIKANPNMPGGYSATIVAVTETGLAKSAPKGATYAAKLSAVTSSQTSTPSRAPRSNLSGTGSNLKRSTPKSTKVTRGTDTSTRECDLQVPVEWYRYNLVDAVDALEYSLQRLNKLKKEATSRYLRTRTVDEMKGLHKTLDRLLNTSATRFNEIKENLNKELKQYIMKKTGGALSDDDDVEILQDVDDDPIFIDENSIESNSNDLLCHESSEVDLTGVGSSDHNESGEILSNDSLKINNDIVNTNENGSPCTENKNIDCRENFKEDNNDENYKENKSIQNSKDSSENCDTQIAESKPVKHKIDDEVNENDVGKSDDSNDCSKRDAENQKGLKDDENDNCEKKYERKQILAKKEQNGENEEDKQDDNINKGHINDDGKKISPDDNSNQDNDGKVEDSEMSEEMIETLLKDDNADEIDNVLNNKAMEVVEGS